MARTSTLAPAQEINVLRLVWISFLVGVAVYTVAFAMLRRAQPSLDPEVATTLRPAFWIAALGLAWLSTWWHQRFAGQSVTAAQGSGSADAGATAVAIERLRTGCIVAWAMSEAVAILGLLLGFLTHRSEDFLPFAFGAVALLYMHRPATWPLEQFLRDAHAAGNPP